MAKIKKFIKKFFFIGKLNLLYVPIIFGIIFTFYSLNKSSVYSSVATLTKTVPTFENYFNKFNNSDYKRDYKRDYKSSFEYIFISKITSANNFQDFINSYDKIQLSNDNKKLINKSFINFLYDSNYFHLQRAYSSEFYRLEIKYLNYIDGSKLLNDYVQFTIKDVLFYLIKTAELSVIKKIDATKNLLETLNTINDPLNTSNDQEINDPLNILIDQEIKNMDKKNIDNLITEKENLYLSFNVKFLGQKLKNYNNELLKLKKIYEDNSLQQINFIKGTDEVVTKNLKDNTFSWNPITRSQNNEKKVNHLNYFIQGIIFGLMINLLFITFKIIIQRNMIK